MSRKSSILHKDAAKFCGSFQVLKIIRKLFRDDRHAKLSTTRQSFVIKLKNVCILSCSYLVQLKWEKNGSCWEWCVKTLNFVSEGVSYVTRSLAHHFLSLSTSVNCCQDGGAALQVIWLASTLSAAAHRDGVDIAAVAVTGTVVTCLPSVPWCPDENGAPPVPALRLIGEAGRGDSFINDIYTSIRRER